VRADRQREWSKREQNDFRVALMQHGAGDWDLIRVKAGLHKSIDQIEEYFEFLVDQCKHLVETRPAVKPASEGDSSKEEKIKAEGESMDIEQEDGKEMTVIEEKEEKEDKMEEKEEKMEEKVKQVKQETEDKTTAASKASIITSEKYFKILLPYYF
jgi:hypothetical protein